MTEKFDSKNAPRLEDPERLVELPPAGIVRLLDISGDETVVDFGAGTGVYSIPVAEALPHGTLYAVDEQEELLGLLRAKLAESSSARVKPLRSLEGRVPLPNGAADRVFMVNVLHHVDDDPAALREIMRLLAPGGRMVVVDFARMDRPVGPPNDHVLALEDARAVLVGMGLREVAVYQPGEVGRYSIAIVADKPDP